MIRKCIFTGLEAKSKTKLVFLDKEHSELHNWSNSVPCNLDYTTYRQSRSFNKDEVECFKIFWEIETLRLLSVFQNSYGAEITISILEERLAKMQEENRKKLASWLKNKPDSVSNKDKQIEIAYAQREIVEENTKEVEQFLEKRKKLWE